MVIELLSVTYPLLQAAGDLRSRKALHRQLQVLLPTVQHVLVDGRPKLHLRASTAVSKLLHPLTPRACCHKLCMAWAMQLIAGDLHSLVCESCSGVGGSHHHLGVLSLDQAPDARQGLQEVNDALHIACAPTQGHSAGSSIRSREKSLSGFASMPQPKEREKSSSTLYLSP